MATVAYKGTALDAAGDYKDSVTRKYQVNMGSGVSNEYTALSLALAAGLPARRAYLVGSPQLFVSNIHGEPESAQGTIWNFDVTFSPPPSGEDDDQQNPNPLLRPPVFNVEYIETEYVVKQAKNQTALTGGFTRPIGTLGPIVNAAFRRPDEPIVRTRRIPVIVIEQNFPDLGVILDRNEDFQDTTNSDSITLGSKTFDPRRLKFEVCRSLGKQLENDIVFYPGVTEIQILKSTDLILDNVGFHYWDAAENSYIRAKDSEGNETAEPVNLELDGTLKATGGVGDTGTTTITYRDLDEVAYSDFFS